MTPQGVVDGLSTAVGALSVPTMSLLRRHHFFLIIDTANNLNNQIEIKEETEVGNNTIESNIENEEECEGINVNDLTPEEIEMIGEDGYRVLMSGEEMRKNPRAFNKEDRLNNIKELTFWHKALKVHWTKEEIEEKRAEYEKWFEAEREKAGGRIGPLIEATNKYKAGL